MAPLLLIVDDDPHSLSALQALVEAEGFESLGVGELRAAREAMAAAAPLAVLADYYLPDGTGPELAADCAAVGADLVMVTGRASIDTAVETLRVGATDFLQKPVDAARLKTLLDRIRRSGYDREELAALRSTLREFGRFGSMIGDSPVMQAVFDRISRIAPSTASVLITGESGTGKELVAETLHRLSERRHRPFIAVNCGAISPTLIESELFGHERGSFTGAERQRKGVFERAHLGTLFLDEISEMPLELQVKLLRVLETGSFQRVGGERVLSTNVRIVSASNRDLDAAIAAGRFRADLLYRLRVVPIDLPPLRERGDDVLLLAEHFLAEFADGDGRRKTLSPGALAALRSYSWPGNVRELRNALQHASLMAESEIGAADLPVAAQRQALPTAARLRDGQEIVEIPIPANLRAAEREVILATLRRLKGNKAEAASALGISLKTLYTRINEYNARAR